MKNLLLAISLGIYFLHVSCINNVGNSEVITTSKQDFNVSFTTSSDQDDRSIYDSIIPKKGGTSSTRERSPIINKSVKEDTPVKGVNYHKSPNQSQIDSLKQNKTKKKFK